MKRDILRRLSHNAIGTFLITFGLATCINYDFFRRLQPGSAPVLIPDWVLGLFLLIAGVCMYFSKARNIIRYLLIAVLIATLPYKFHGNPNQDWISQQLLFLDYLRFPFQLIMIVWVAWATSNGNSGLNKNSQPC